MSDSKFNVALLEKVLNGWKISARTKRFFQLIVAALWGGILFYILYRGWTSWDKIAPVILKANYSHIGLAVIYYLINLIAAIIAWLTIIRTFDNHPGWWINLQIFCVTFAARRIPGTFWYIGGRMIMYQKIGIAKTSVLIASAIELLASIVSAGVLGIGFLFLAGHEIQNILTGVILVVILVSGVLLHPRILLVALNKSNIPISFRANTKDWLLWILSFVVMWLMGGMMVVEIVQVLQPVSLMTSLYIIGAWSLSALAGIATFFLPSSFGAAELSLIAFLAKILPFALAGSVALFTRMFTMFFEVILALAFYPIAFRFARNLTGDQEGSPSANESVGNHVED